MSLTPLNRYDRRLDAAAYRSRSLPCGLTLVEVHQPHLHRGTVSVFFKAGSRFESSEENGISHFLEHMIFRGTEGLETPYAQNLAVERLGGTLFAATAPDTTEFSITLPMETLDEGSRLLATILTKPILGGIDIERNVIAEEVLEDMDESGQSIDIDYISRARLWPRHPLGQSIAGPLENIRAFTMDDIRRHFRRTYVAQNAVVCISGGYDAKSLPEVVTDSFETLATGGATPLAVPPELAEGPSIRHVRKPGSQTQLRLAFHAPGEDDPESVPLDILLGMLDDGMSTRLHRRIIDEKGLAYNIGAGMDAYHDVAAFNIDVTASHTKLAEVTRELLSIVFELKAKPISGDELEKAKRRAAWSMEEFLDDPHGMAAWYGEQALFRQPPTLQSRREAFLAVTEEAVARVAAKVFTLKRLHLSTVGAVSPKIKRDIQTAVDSFR